VADERAVHAHDRGAADPLHDAGGNELRQARRERAEQRAEREDGDPGLIDRPVAHPLAQRGERQQQRDDHQLVGVDHPDRGRGRGADLARDARQRDVGDGAVEHGHGDADRDRQHGEVALRRRQAVGVDLVGQLLTLGQRHGSGHAGPTMGRCGAASRAAGPLQRSSGWPRCSRPPDGSYPMARTNPFQFIQQVRAEVAKVTWPTRRETGLTTIMVMIMATLFATFFFLVDLIIRFGLETILRFAS
jgi:preprotein translocase subunit SecE